MGQAKIRKNNGTLTKLAMARGEDRVIMTKTMTPDMAALVVKTLDSMEMKSFGDRNPALGKMFNCPGCKTRHRGQRCEIKYFDKDAK